MLAGWTWPRFDIAVVLFGFALLVTLYGLINASSLRVTRADGTLAFFAPVTTGGEYDPLPIGEWKATGINWHPVFHYNPKLFWDAKATDSKAALKAGPNNPVGVVWIDLNLEHYGIHGTPSPGKVSKAESHGCVRLTNWDAERVADRVSKGTPVEFVDDRKS